MVVTKRRRVLFLALALGPLLVGAFTAFAAENPDPVGVRIGPLGKDVLDQSGPLGNYPPGRPELSGGYYFWSIWYTSPGIDLPNTIDTVWFKAAGNTAAQVAVVEKIDLDGSGGQMIYQTLPANGAEQEFEVDVNWWPRVRAALWTGSDGESYNGYCYLTKVQLYDSTIITFPAPTWAGGTVPDPLDPGDVDPPDPPVIPDPLEPVTPPAPTWPTLPDPGTVDPPSVWPDPDDDWTPPVPDIPVDPAPGEPGGPVIDPLPGEPGGIPEDPIPTPDPLPGDPGGPPAADPVPTPDDPPTADPLPEADPLLPVDPVPTPDDPPTADPLPEADPLLPVDPLPETDPLPPVDPLPELDPITEPTPLPGGE